MPDDLLTTALKTSRAIRANSNDFHTGVVKWFSRAKGYGFVIPDNPEDGDPEGGNPEVYAHFTQIQGEGYRNLHEGERVEYILVQAERGPAAHQIKVLK